MNDTLIFSGLIVALGFIGIAGLLLRRNFFFSLLSMNYLVLTVTLIFGLYGGPDGEFYGVSLLLIDMILTVVISIWLGHFFQRHKNLDMESIDSIKEDA